METEKSTTCRRHCHRLGFDLSHAEGMGRGIWQYAGHAQHLEKHAKSTFNELAAAGPIFGPSIGIAFQRATVSADMPQSH